MLGCGDRSSLFQSVFTDGYSKELAFSREYGLGPGREGQDPSFLPFWRTMICHQMFVEVNSRAGLVKITGNLTCVSENLLWLPGRMKPVTHKRGTRTRQRGS